MKRPLRAVLFVLLVLRFQVPFAKFLKIFSVTATALILHIRKGMSFFNAKLLRMSRIFVKFA